MIFFYHKPSSHLLFFVFFFFFIFFSISFSLSFVCADSCNSCAFPSSLQLGFVISIFAFILPFRVNELFVLHEWFFCFLFYFFCLFFTSIMGEFSRPCNAKLCEALPFKELFLKSLLSNFFIFPRIWVSPRNMVFLCWKLPLRIGKKGSFFLELLILSLGIIKSFFTFSFPFFYQKTITRVEIF